MSKPRTPEHFPRMKVRGGRRREAAAFESFVHFDWVGFGRRVQAALDGFATALSRIGEGLTRLQEAYRLRSWVAGRQSRNTWVATHQLTATVSPYAAPMAHVEGVHEYGHGIVVRGRILGDATQLPGYPR